MKLFRHNKRKQKKGCGCKLCKAHKGKWVHFFKANDRGKALFDINELKNIQRGLDIY